MLKELRLPFIFLFVFTGLLLIYLAMNPQVDIRFSSYFFSDGQFIGNTTKVTAIFDLFVYLVCTGIFLVAGILVFRLLNKEGRINEGAARLLLFMCVLMIGSVCIQTLKFTVERPRPYSITEFGGPNTFIPALKAQDSTDVFVGNENRSFASGHTASAFSLISLSIVARRKRNRFLLSGFGLFFSLFIGLLRISEGNHFLSDIAGGIGLISLITILLDFIFPSFIAKVNHTFFKGK